MSSSQSDHNFYSRRPILAKLFLLALIVLGASTSNAGAQIFDGWGPSQRYDWGWNPSVAISQVANRPALVEVHNGGGSAGPLWYHVGQFTASGINWGNSYRYDSGFNPSVAMDGSTVVEAHNGGGSAGPLFYRLGQVSGQIIQWGPSVNYDWGFNPSVAMVGSTVVEVHNGGGSAGPLWYRVGQIVFAPFTNSPLTIQWGNSYQYDWGWNPSVGISSCITNSNVSCGLTLVEVHNGGGSAGPLWYHVGAWTAGQTIQWGQGHQFDSGWNPKVAFCCGATIFEVHNGGSSAGPLWYHYTQWNGGSTIGWGNSSQYDWGYNPSVAITGLNPVEVHDGTNAPGPLWYHAGQIQIIP